MTAVGARGQDWGRLLLRWPASGDIPSARAAEPTAGPPTRLTILIERAASTLALGRLIRRDAEGLERQIHRTLLTALLDHSRPVDEIALRAKVLGVQLDRRHLVGVMVRHRADDPTGDVGPEVGQARLRDLSEAVGQALREAKLTALTSAVDDNSVGALLALPDPAAEDRALSAFASALRRVRLDAGSGRTPSGADPSRVSVPVR
ncbi:hypothetical protein NKG94_49430 [Micromonospora sp. M12]